MNGSVSKIPPFTSLSVYANLQDLQNPRAALYTQEDARTINEIIDLVPSLKKSANESPSTGQFAGALVPACIDNGRLYVKVTEQTGTVLKMTTIFINTTNNKDVYVELTNNKVSANSILAAPSNPQSHPNPQLSSQPSISSPVSHPPVSKIPPFTFLSVYASIQDLQDSQHSLLAQKDQTMIDEIIRLVPSLQKGLNESALLGKNFDAPLVIGRIENCRLYVTCVEQGEMVQKMTNTYIPTIDTDVYVQLRKYDVSANSILAARSNAQSHPNPQFQFHIQPTRKITLLIVWNSIIWEKNCGQQQRAV